MKLEWLRDLAKPVNKVSTQAALARQENLTKPAGSLGQLESLAVRFAGLQGREIPQLKRIAIRVFAADHGVAARGVSAFPQSVTAQMVQNFCSGGAAICVLADSLGAEFKVVNLGCVAAVPAHPVLVDAIIAPATQDFTVAKAMSAPQLEAALNAGRNQVNETDMFIGGEMGIGNTTAASALLAALYHLPAEVMTGHGTGIDETALKRKVAVIDQALALHDATVQDPMALLGALGGFEIAALVGAYITCAQRGIPVIVDGFITTAAAAIAVAVNPSIKPWLVFSHLSDESGHAVALAKLGVTPLLSLDLRLGEGSGAALAANLVRQALNLHGSMATFAEAGVADAD
ncbi:nicotinate-nucleotide--dimethylbenzimidazole phosphoribosyltransferase [Gilvimarinus sp. SDUM040013]|uniref:Nicotinate-nucleotide--dimethylbenzimidazole phosphoribosyltransferase n=1 Tax=Gilvimarinus gilvus TaxID=3058038 RepID=A0ABU4RYY5_9GAMM|nr:nicotinate-nucleotide--dimethylbenzimidazole phosphoribosyltransferase [Gilvimarinus sp. SDUM040013]MDO3384571.1 nicotinate-nucleotide--dimethylbenzimidazole phosphoribosyltransferase [Gilvimarinus sp. SDUM040013]MDX6850093.1 nicotinate-nucleotide--dimethylbenzimidazole phosphoribosyltransferase [Gilvimarinus sp. SDUM040013]